MLTKIKSDIRSQYELHCELSKIEPRIESKVIGFLQTRRYLLLQEARRTRRGILQVAAGLSIGILLGLTVKSPPLVVVAGGATGTTLLMAVAQSNPRIYGKRATLDFISTQKQREYSALCNNYDELAVTLAKAKPGERLQLYIESIQGQTAVDPTNIQSLIVDTELKGKVLKLIQNPCLESGVSFESVRVNKRWDMKRPPKHILRQIINELLSEGKIIEVNNKYLIKK
jgi:hypothetical protein